nr:fluoride efflux transporter CrcB [Mesobacillus persicus]
MSFLLIGVGGALGAICRYSLGLFVAGRTKSSFPYGTWIINISGSILLGIVFNLHINGAVADWVMLFVGVGFCGAFTTFSTFGNEIVQLIVANKWKLAVGYVVTSVVVSFLAAWVGFLL